MTIGHELFRNEETDWTEYAERMAQLDWRKAGPMWEGNVVMDGRIINQQKPIRMAVEKVREAIQWDPSLDSPTIES